MTYVDGFVLAVPADRKEAFREHAASQISLFRECGVRRQVECWGDDVPHGKLTDFFMAVQAKEDESVVFSWIEWPDKATRDAGMARFSELMQTDERFDATKNPPPFDGKRMIFGGFAPILMLGK